jgi:hypothetical protein
VVCSDRCRCIECRNYSNSIYRSEAIQKMQIRARQVDMEGSASEDCQTNIIGDDKIEGVMNVKSFSAREKGGRAAVNMIESDESGALLSSFINQTGFKPTFISDDMIDEVRRNGLLCCADRLSRCMSVLMRDFNRHLKLFQDKVFVQKVRLT